MKVELGGKYRATPQDLASKYDSLAEGFAEASYANLAFYMERRFLITTTWGKALSTGDSLLELGCGDGYLAQLFVEHGLRYCGVDISPKMIAVAKQRLMERKLEADFMVADINRMILSERYDAVASCMRAFFTYVADPLAVLKQLRPFIRKKIIIDLEPRRDIPIARAIDMMNEAGYKNVSWRPFFVPEKKKVPASILKALVACEEIPVVRSVPLRWKFLAVLKGEVG